MKTKLYLPNGCEQLVESNGIIWGAIASIGGICLGVLTAVIVDKVIDSFANRSLKRELKNTKKRSINYL